MFYYNRVPQAARLPRHKDVRTEGRQDACGTKLHPGAPEAARLPVAELSAQGQAGCLRYITLFCTPDAIEGLPVCDRHDPLHGITHIGPCGKIL